MTRSRTHPGVWLDFSNSPHIPFFKPIVAELEAQGVSVLLTARDFAQTVELARLAFEDVDVIGSWGRGAVAKSNATLTRASALIGHIRGQRPRLAVSHNSYAQLLAARALGVPAVTMMDYEHQPANHLAFRLATLVMVPEAFPTEALRRQGARRAVRYPGFKEQVYLDNTPPSDLARKSLGVDDEVLAVLRPPPDFAAYHRFENPLFEQAVDRLLGHPDIVALVLPRTPAQAAWIEERWGGRIQIPDRVVPTIDLLWAADLVVGAGGTMNRESALLGTPTYSLFAGAPSAVDQVLVARGLMTRLASSDDLDRLLVCRKAERTWLPQGRSGNGTRDAIVQTIFDLVDADGQGHRRGQPALSRRDSDHHWRSDGGVDVITPPQADDTRVANAFVRGSLAYEVAKRMIDIVVAGTAIILLLPALIVISLLVRATSKGGAIFRQTRVGRDQRPFTLLKFRSMRVDSDEAVHRAYIDHLMTSSAPKASEGGLYKLTGDPRVTRVGAFLRRTSLDELPQLLNILRGQMSLVGPRPALAFEVAYYAPHHNLRFTAKPGLTGLWQVSGRNSLTMRQALDLDVEYVQRRGLLLDLRIMIRTIPTLLELGA